MGPQIKIRMLVGKGGTVTRVSCDLPLPAAKQGLIAAMLQDSYEPN